MITAVNKKRKCLSFEIKLNISEEVERQDKSKTDVCQDYSIAK